MAGMGPPPKDPSKRARRNKDPVALKVIESEPVEQPPLPELMPKGVPWPEETLQWWAMWGNDPLAADFRATDWSELMDTAAVHGAYWSGDLSQAGELRLRTARHGATAADRARLRITYAQADEADEKRRTSRSGADVRGRYKGLKAVD